MLDCKRHSKILLESLASIPIGESKTKTDYMTKVGLYDAKCGACGFNRIEVKDKVFHNVQEAIMFAIETNNDIVRTCEYPGNVFLDHDGNDVYPSLTEIIINTCLLWDEHE